MEFRLRILEGSAFRFEPDSEFVESEMVCKVMTPGAKILSGNSRLLNFYFDVVRHDAGEPLEVIPF